MALIRPRLTDFHNLAISQEDADFAIPFLDEDIPLCVDPFLLWKSPSLQDNALYAGISNAFNHLGYLANHKKEDEALNTLILASECDEVGLGFSGTRRGNRVGRCTAQQILSLFSEIPQIKACGFTHFEEIQLYVDQIAKDRISDIACNFLKSFLIDYTIERCQTLGIPTSPVVISNVYDLKTRKFIENETVPVPSNPETGKAILFVPKRWLRRAPWINYDDYVSGFYIPEIISTQSNGSKPDRIAILSFNRHNYDVVQSYVKQKERVQADCKTDPLFRQIPVGSIKRKLATMLKLPNGTTNKADKLYEDLLAQMMASMLYPHLDFADEQSRTESGTLIRDLVFYNNRSLDFLKDINSDFGTRQIVMEMKNVKEIERDHINQLNRYLNNEFGRFGILLTRNPLSTAMYKNTIDLWSGQRRCIIALCDQDVAQMATVFSSKQRLPIEVIKAKYIQFIRSCPS